MIAAQLAKRLRAKKIGKGKWLAKCPAHSDHKPSLSVREGKEAIMINCFSGCGKKAVLSALGLTFRDLWYSDKRLTGRELRELEEKARAQELEEIRQYQHLMMLVRKCNRYADEARDAMLRSMGLEDCIQGDNWAAMFHRLLAQARSVSDEVKNIERAMQIVDDRPEGAFVGRAWEPEMRWARRIR